MGLQFEWEIMPPSVNTLYFYKSGRRILSTAGRAWKNRFVQGIGGADPNTLFMFSPDPYDKYLLDITYYFSPGELHIRSYKEGRYKSGIRKSPYKKLDVSNLLKVTEDAISELLKIDDRSNFEIRIRKIESENHEGFVATLTKL